MGRLLLWMMLLSASSAPACAQATPMAGATPTLKAKTRIVVIDVVVTDKQGKPVRNLEAPDFALAENGAPQTINHFEGHTSLSAENVAELAAVPKLEPNIFTNFSPAPPNSALNVLVFDALNTKMEDQADVLKQMRKYLATAHPGVRMELFALNAQLRLLQGFTSDQKLLTAALDNPRSAPQASLYMSRPMSEETGIVRGRSNYGQSTGADLAYDDPIDDPALARLLAANRPLATLQAMNALARYMGGLPGRKNLLWFSASFPISRTDPKTQEMLHETMALFAKNQVAVYPIGPRGLIALPAVAPPAAGNRVASIILNKNDAEVLTMEQMADDTGGKVFASSNDFAAAVNSAIEDGSNYYTLTYTPTNKEWKGDFRKVQVKLAKAGYKLTYRPGYYAEDDDKPVRAVVAAADAASVKEVKPDPAKMALHQAMEYGSPQPADIVFKAAINPATGHVEDVVAKGNSLSPKVPAPFERYVISVAALPGDFTFRRGAAGKMHVGAQMVTCVYSADGALINAASIRIDNDVDDARYQSILANGMKFQQEISVPVKGESFLRIGLEDLATSRVGVVEIPVATLAKLKPLAAPIAAK